MSLNPELVSYIRENVFPRYAGCDPAHRLPHIEYVIRRSMDFAATVDADLNIAYAVAAYHDLGCAVDRATHHIESAKIVREDADKLSKFFTSAEISVIAQAVEDHRMSNKAMPRTVYGDIVAAADKPSTVDMIFQRLWEYRREQFAELGMARVVSDAFSQVTQRYARGGSSEKKVRFLDNDLAYQDMVAKMRGYAADRDSFERDFRSFAMRTDPALFVVDNEYGGLGADETFTGSAKAADYAD